MKKINHIFYSLQGEGFHTGRPAVFIRFAGCNLRCSFCDTYFDDYREMSEAEIVSEAARHPARFAILTGGEPSLQADEAFVERLHAEGFTVAMESNGTHAVPQNLDWLTVSPKRPWHEGCETAIGRHIDELKVVFTDRTDPDKFLPPEGFARPTLLFLQPCDTGDAAQNKRITDQCIDYIKHHPEWRLSLQTHKLAGFE